MIGLYPTDESLHKRVLHLLVEHVCNEIEPICLYEHDAWMLQVQGKERELVAQTGRQLGLDGTYIPRSYIEQVQTSVRNAYVRVAKYSPSRALIW